MEINKDTIQVIGFDADDTLWVNETYFREAEEEFARLLSSYETVNKIDQELFKKEMDNLSTYGYGIKAFVLSMIESAIELSNNTISHDKLSRILNIGKEMIHKPVELLPGVVDTLKGLKNKYKLILATKGDLLDQERKLEKSGLSSYFHHIEILSEKKEVNYLKLLTHLDIEPQHFLMIGNSLKSDILPLVNIGAQAIHIPFHTTWAHEVVEINDDEKAFATFQSIDQILSVL